MKKEREQEKDVEKNRVKEWFSLCFSVARTCDCACARVFSQSIVAADVLRGGCDSSCGRGRKRRKRGEDGGESESCSRGRKQRVGAGIDISTRETFLPLAGLRRFKVLFFSVLSLSAWLSSSLSRLRKVTVFFPQPGNKCAQNCKFRPLPSLVPFDAGISPSYVLFFLKFPFLSSFYFSSVSIGRNMGFK